MTMTLSDRIPTQTLLVDLAQRLQLRHRLVALDLEATGVDTQTDRIVQIAGYVVNPVAQEDGDYEVWAIGPHLINPERPIPAEAIEVHGITDAMVAGELTFRDLALVIAPVFAGDVPIAVLAYNGDYDTRLLAAEFARAQQPDAAEALITAPLIDPYRIYLPVQHYCGRPHEGGHDAQADIVATIEVLVHQLDLLDETVPVTVTGLDDYGAQRDATFIDRDGKFRWKSGEAVCMVGKWKGVPLRRVEKSYLAWIARAEGFAADTKRIAADAAQGRYPAAPTRTQSAGAATPAESPACPSLSAAVSRGEVA